MDHQALASEVLRALRGPRSQVAFSRRLGYRSNVAYAWESGRRHPTASETFRAAARVGIDVRAAVAPFFQHRLPDELAEGEPTTPSFVAALMRAIRGKLSMRRLAQRCGVSRSAVSRLLSGATEPRLPLFLRFVDAATGRVIDLLSGFVSVEALPAARQEYQRHEALRRLAYDNPLSEAVPRFLELEDYEALPRHEPGWIAARLDVSLEEEERTLADLATAGVVRFDGERWLITPARSVDTSRDPTISTRLRAHWTSKAHARIRSQGEGNFSYLVFGADDDTLAAMEELRLKFHRELRTLVRSCPGATRVAVAVMHLFPIDVGAPDAQPDLVGPREPRVSP